MEAESIFNPFILISIVCIAYLIYSSFSAVEAFFNLFKKRSSVNKAVKLKSDIKCPKCHLSYVVKVKNIDDNNNLLRCFDCGHIFIS